jgi:hypothetical protein
VRLVGDLDQRLDIGLMRQFNLVIDPFIVSYIDIMLINVWRKLRRHEILTSCQYGGGIASVLPFRK